MMSSPYLEILAVVVGLLAGSCSIYLAPRIVAHRLDEPPELPGPIVLVPLAGGWLAGYRPIRAVLFQAAVAVTLAGLAAHYGATVRLPIAGAFCILLALITYIDIDHRLVLNVLSLPGIVAALLLSIVWPRFGLESAVLGAAVGFAIFLALQIIGRGALGMGDTKLAALIGAMRGLPTVFNAVLLGVILGGLGAAFYLFVLRRGRKEYMPYGPYLAVGAILSFFLFPP